ncbi:MAG: MerR family DNA-binding transcriptional regulator [Eisenbergiella massiliensis]
MKNGEKELMIVCRNFLRYDNEKKEMQRSFSVKEGYYLIGEVSKITGIPKDTLHFYSKTGLLVPDYVDEQNQYRYTPVLICGSLISSPPAEN